MAKLVQTTPITMVYGIQITIITGLINQLITGGHHFVAGWFMREHPIYKWMMTGGMPIYGNFLAGKIIEL